MYDFEVATLVLSAKNWRALCGPMCLCVDHKARDFLRKLGVLHLYDRIHLFDPQDFADINRCYFWAAGKVVAAGKFPSPFVVLDFDCLIHEKPKFALDSAVQTLNFERNYPCYQDCESKYGGILNLFDPPDWEASPVNVGMVGYYDQELKDEYVGVAIDAMRRISQLDPRSPAVNRFRDHIIFVEQKLLPMMVKKRSLKLSVFEDGLFDGFLSTPRVTHLWGIKGEYLRRSEWKMGFLEGVLKRYPRFAKGITNRATMTVLSKPARATRVFLPDGTWGSQGTKGWESMVSDASIKSRLPAMHCLPMPCGVTRSAAGIHFETKEGADAYVKYGPSEGEIDKHSTRRAYRQTLFNFTIPNGESDFSPGGIVHYRVRARPAGRGAFNEGLAHSFRLARAATDAGPWCCSVGSDCAGEAEGTLHQDFKDYHWPAAGRQGEEFHIAAGGVIRAAAERGRGIAAWRGFRNDLEGVGREGEKCGDLPVFFCIGEDEEDGIHWEARGARCPLGAFLQLPGQQTRAGDPGWKMRYYYFTWGQALFIALDGETSYSPGRIGHTQRMWIEETLTAHRGSRWKVIFSHRPVDEPNPGAVGTIAQSRADRKWLLHIMRKHKVSIFLHGHYHGWRVHKNGAAPGWHICASWGSETHPTRGSWNGQSYFCRFHFGERWNGKRYEAHPSTLTVEVVDPFRKTAGGGRVHRRFTIPS